MNRMLLAVGAALAAVWLAAAWVVESKTAAMEREYLQKKALVERYEALGRLWSTASRKKSLKKMERMLRLYGVTPKKSGRGQKRIYRFELSKRRADSVLNKLLNLPLAIRAFGVQRVADDRLEVTVEVAL